MIKSVKVKIGGGRSRSVCGQGEGGYDAKQGEVRRRRRDATCAFFFHVWMKTFNAMRPSASLPFASSSNASTLSSRLKRCVMSLSIEASLPDERSVRASGYVLAYRKEPRMSTSRVAAAEMGSMTLHEPIPMRRTFPPAVHACTKEKGMCKYSNFRVFFFLFFF